MTRYLFSKLVPGGNPTIILHDPDVTAASLAEISTRLMSPLHLQAEQVGALYAAVPGTPPQPPRLIMMGGEFCVNATRAAAMLLARQGALKTLDGAPPGEAAVRCGALRVSGMEAPVRVLASSDAAVLARALETGAGESGEAAWPAGADAPESDPAVSMVCAARIEGAAGETACRVLEEGVILVPLPGISHLLVDADRHGMPDSTAAPVWRQASAGYRVRSGLTGTPASGVVWFRREGAGFRIWPAVEVLATASEHMESACGSASLALALWNRQKGGPAEASLAVRQPSGEILHVFPSRALPGAAWIAGPVVLAAQGTAYL